ncbi:urease accessory protein UreD [Kutzneria kofuensis]|uniref:Urease accessory protein UreD n=1 Tax=Kutzneria kofuensis TaxID=103725 RepID=A0A7W9KH13_9PSEU|nr:urease accessory protein UreD [Kutzneria kofuensis]MBB5892068.1 urease accessory protein [Kutzneria kofuensis]
MRARARLVAELRDGRTVLSELRSAAPWTLLPQRNLLRRGADTAVVHLVSSATAPLGGDDLSLAVSVGPGAKLQLRGIAATLALPGHRGERSHASIHVDIDVNAALEFLPEPTVVTSRASHSSAFAADLADSARLRCREVLVLGRVGEPPGDLDSTVEVVRGGTPLLRQRIDVGDPALSASAAYLAGHRVLATELLVWGEDAAAARSGDWWSLAPLARGGSLATALARDAVTAQRRLAAAVAGHPGLSTVDAGF